MVVTGIIDNVTNDLENWAEDVINPIENFAQSIWNKAVSAWDYADNIYNSVIPNIVNDLENWAFSEFQRLGNAVGSVWDSVKADVMSLIDQATSDLENWATIMVNNVATDLQNWTNDAINLAISGLGDIESLAKQAFDDAWSVIKTDVIDPIVTGYDDLKAAADDIGARLDQAWQWIEGEATDVVNAVEKAWDWIVWLGDHTISDLKSMFAAVPETVNWSDAEGWINADIEGLGQMIDGVMSDVFGGV